MSSDAASALAWEQPACPLCGGRQVAPRIEAPDRLNLTGPQYRVVCCEGCGLCFTHPRPTVSTIGAFYPVGYEPHQVRDRPAQRRRDRWYACLPGAWRARHPQRCGVPFHGRRRLLDVGCGGGAFLLRMHRQGWTVQGLDASAAAVEQVRSVCRLPASLGTLPHPELSPASFDVLTMWQSLEHFHDPLGALREAFRLLVSGGRLYVSVPNLDSGAFRWFGPGWLGLDLPRHLTHFAPPTLRKMLEAAGFRVVALRQIAQRGWLQQSAALARQQGLPLGWRHLAARRWPARVIARWFQLTGQSDCQVAAAVRM